MRLLARLKRLGFRRIATRIPYRHVKRARCCIWKGLRALQQEILGKTDLIQETQDLSRVAVALDDSHAARFTRLREEQPTSAARSLITNGGYVYTSILLHRELQNFRFRVHTNLKAWPTSGVCAEESSMGSSDDRVWLLGVCHGDIPEKCETMDGKLRRRFWWMLQRLASVPHSDGLGL